MAPRRESNPTEELLQKLLIVQLGLAGVPQRQIRKIVGCSTNVVTGIVKHLRVREVADK
jgi:transposase